MDWPDDLTAELPARRDDEPPALRDQIVRELRDHLHCAFQRELLRTGNEIEAVRRVLAKFGDPARLARKLWFDAMWEKIIMQRMTFAALVVVVIASITSTGLTWFVVGQAQQVNRALLDESKAGVAALLAESRKANEALLEKMTAAQGEANAAPSMEWNSVRVQMVPESPDGPPPSGFEVSLRGHLLDTANGMTLVRITGPDGMADFGLVRPGEHSLRFKASWGESSDRSVTVFPGKAQTVEVPYPTKIEDAEIAISVDWPGDLAGRDYWLMCDFVRTPRKVGDQSWSRDADVGLQMVVVTPVGSVINFDRATVKAWINEKFHEVPHVADYELRFFSVSC